MKVVLDGVAKGRRAHALPATSLAFESGRATLVTAETDQRPTVLGLIAAGRMRPSVGRVEVDGRADDLDTRRRVARVGALDPAAAAMRRRIALVDAPGVSDPEPNVTLAGVVAEELMFAGRRSDPVAVRRWLDEQGLGGEASVPVSNVAPAARVRALCELAVLRPGVEGVVLVSPDRHGGEPGDWWTIAESLAAHGYAVLVIAGRASQSVLETTPRRDRGSSPSDHATTANDTVVRRETAVSASVRTPDHPRPSRVRLRRATARPTARTTARTKGGRA
ncbi:hypothetical protein AB1K54_15265 [Microbacterium sp. BWT-B31]|uniref:hypothetical protein n=1 Tax=Microbacterium sp. BWT-B31 TaxID=3232072 RepID=UPI003528128A